MANQSQRTDEEVVTQLAQTSVIGHKMPKESTARLRWTLLSKALNPKSTDVQTSSDSVSVRRFESFGLIKLTLKEVDDNDSSHDIPIHFNEVNNDILDGKWFECSLWDQSIQSFGQTLVEIKLLSERIPIYELLHSLDNTGNVCLWPSEEVLTYYSVKNRNFSSNRTVLELGGGMTCLCSLSTAASVAAKRVILTDGNQRCISNIRTIVEKNRHRLKSRVECRQLVWGQTSDYSDLYNQIDVIFCSDCLYFDESRHQLVDTIFSLLKRTGIAILLAPTRGLTFNLFVELAKDRFEFEIIENYDQLVHELNRSFVETAVDRHYVPDLHYPVMIRLRHKSSAE